MSAAPSVALERVMAPRLVDPSAFPDEEFDLYSIPAFDQGAPEILPGNKIGSTKQVVEPGDVLLSRIVPHIRRAWIVWPNRNRRIIASGEWIVFRGSDIEPRYIRHVLVGDPFHAEFMRTVSGVGGSLLRARPKYVAKIHVSLPPLPEQRRIAAILDQADALRAKRRAAIAKLDELTQSIFLDMFGDPATNPKGWPMGRIGDLLRSVSYGTSKKADALVGAYPVIRMNNVTYAGEWDFSNLKYVDLQDRELPKYLVSRGQILFNRTNSKELVGKTAVYRGDKPMAFAGYLVRAIANGSADPEYIGAYMNTSYVKEYLRAKCKSIVGMANINAKEFQAIPVPEPPAALQKRFAEVVARVRRERDRHSKCAVELSALFASLQHRAFRGEL